MQVLELNLHRKERHHLSKTRTYYMKRQFCTILGLLLLLLVLQGRTQPAVNWAFNYINDKNGLKGQSVYKFFKDSDGVIWIGTNMGVSSFNGQTITNYDINCMPPLSIVSDITESADGDILLCCRNGLYRADMEQKRCVRVCPEIQQPISFCRAGKQLLIGSEHGIYFYQDGELASPLLLESNAISKSNVVNDMAYDGKENVWIVTNTQVACLNLSKRSFTKYDPVPGINTGHLTSIAKIDSCLYIGTQNYGIIRFDLRTQKGQLYDVGVRCNVIPDLQSQPDKHQLYVSTDGNGAFIIDTARDSILRHYHIGSPQYSLQNNSVYTFFYDRQLDVCWFGFFENGLAYNYHTAPTFTVYRFKDVNTRGLNVRSLAIRDGERVIGTRNGLYFVSETKGITRYYPPEETGSGIITDIEYFAGKYVISTYGNGLYTLDPQTLELSDRHFSFTLRHGRFSRLLRYTDRDTLIAMSDMGIFFLNKDMQAVRTYTSRNSELPDSYFTDILFDRTGKGWIASMERLSLYDPTNQTIQSHGFPEGFFNETGEIGLNLCRNGDILAFSRDNVYRTRPDLSRYTTIDLYDRLQVRQLCFITETPDNHYWVGTDCGLFLFDREFKNFYHFNETDNLPSLRFNKQEFSWSKDTLWLANFQGAVYITPEQYRRIPEKKHYPIVMDNVQIGQQQASPMQLKDINRSKNIQISHNPLSFNKIKGGQITFSLLELNYSYPSGQFFEWQLDDGPYRTGISTAPISLQNLPIGKHRLNIRIPGYPKTAVCYMLYVRPSAAFYVYVILLLMMCVAVFQLIRIRKKRKRLKEAQRRKHALDMRLLEEKVVREMKEQEQMKQQAEAENKIQQMYKRVKLNEDEYAALYQKVKAYMNRERPYTHQELQLSDLATALDTSKVHLSQLFNVYLQQTFFDFINAYRIEEFKRCIKDPAYNQYTITAISEQCGFKRSTFFSVFKKYEGCTPSEYMQNNHINRK